MTDEMPKPAEEATANKSRGIYILPNLFTTGSLFFGFYAIIAAMNHHFDNAAIAIFIAMVFDSLDGRVARLINAQSDFGAEYDSLSDMLSFGVAPALVAYNWSLLYLSKIGLGRLGWLCAFLYVGTVALRLAKFNTQADDDNPLAKRYFFGLPCPSAAAMIASMVWVGDIFQLSDAAACFLTLFVTIAVSVLMISTVHYRSFKDIDLKGNMRFTVMFLIILAFIFVSFRPPHVLLTIFSVYIASGPVAWLIKWRKNRQQTPPA